MKKKYLLSLTIIILISNFTSGQSKKVDTLRVGFICWESVQTTPLVDKMTALINDKNYSEISSFLNSKNSGKIYLAILTLERLSENKTYILNPKEIDKITYWKSSSTLVYNCLGCFPEVETMKELFEKKNSLEENYWLNKVLPNN